MAKKRIARVNEQMKRELIQLLQFEVRDPRVGAVSITDVEVSPDLYHAKVFYAPRGDDEEKKRTLEGLKAAAPFLRTEISKRMSIRKTPELHFALDNTLEHALHIEALLREARQGTADTGRRSRRPRRMRSAQTRTGMWAYTATISMATAAEIEGVLPVDKPVGPTSHDIVGIARRSLHTRRIGHTGTLDPFASGLLLLCIGRATRIAEHLTGMPKRYRAVMRLGVVTDTDDGTGAIVATHDPSSVTTAEIEAALAGQRGDILQTPPPYSAKKRDGVRAYDLARAGVAVQLEPVPVTVHELELVRHVGADVEVDVVASSGTYIRAIARDVGAALGVGAHLTSLRRTAIGSYRVDDALPLDALDNPARVRTALVAPADALPDTVRLDLSEQDVMEIRHGRTVRTAVPDGMVVLTHAGELVALGVATGGVVRPKKVFL